MVIRERADLAREIKAALARSGLSVAGLARVLGVAQPTASKCVNRDNLTVSRLLDIATAAGCELVITFRPRRDNMTPGGASSGGGVEE